MDQIDKKGMRACTTLADLIVYVKQHPNQPIPIDKLRPAVEAQAEYSITLATNMLAHLASNALDNYVDQLNEQAEPNPPTETP